MSTLKVRDARPSDRAKARKVTLSAFQQYAALIPSRWEGYRENILETLSHPEPAEQILAEEGGKIVGSVLLYPAGTHLESENATETRDWPEVRLLAVAPEARGKGIGAALMRECMNRARRSGAAFLTLHTTDMMRVAMRMYEKMGFVRAPEFDFQVDEEVLVKAYRLDLSLPRKEA